MARKTTIFIKLFTVDLTLRRLFGVCWYFDTTISCISILFYNLLKCKLYARVCVPCLPNTVTHSRCGCNVVRTAYCTHGWITWPWFAYYRRRLYIIVVILHLTVDWVQCVNRLQAECPSRPSAQQSPFSAESVQHADCNLGGRPVELRWARLCKTAVSGLRMLIVTLRQVAKVAI